MHSVRCKDGNEHDWNFDGPQAQCSNCGIDQGTYEKLVERSAKIENAVKTLVDELNGGDPKFVAEVMYNEMRVTHRTLQQRFIGALAVFIENMKQMGTDLRNEASIEWCKKVSEIDRCFPFI